jgi:hypothetical protein
MRESSAPIMRAREFAFLRINYKTASLFFFSLYFMQKSLLLIPNLIFYQQFTESFSEWFQKKDR